MRSRLLAFWVVAFLAVSPAFAQGTINAGAVQFVRWGSCWDTSPSANFIGVATPLSLDFLFETGWWFRVAGDTQETAFPPPDSQNYNGYLSTIHWNDVGGRGLFSAIEYATVFDYSAGGSPNGLLSLNLSITNLSAVNPLTIWLYHMADIDLQPTNGNDTATLVEWSPNHVLHISDSGGNFAQYIALYDASHPSHFIVKPFGAGDVGDILSDASVTTFDDSGLPFGPADLTAGWMFPLTIPPSGDDAASVYISVNIPVICYYSFGAFCDGFEKGDSSLWSSSVP